MPSQPPPGSTGRSPRTPAPFQPAPDSTGGSPRIPAPFQPSPGSTGGIPRIPAALSAQAAPRCTPRWAILIKWWLERVEDEEGKIRVAGETFIPREGASSKGNTARRVFRSSAIVKRLGYLTIECEDGCRISIRTPLNIPKTHENGFSEKVCECFQLGFPEQWQGLVNPKMVQKRGHASTCKRLRSGEAHGMPSGGPMKRGHKQKRIHQEPPSKQMVNQGATSTADLTSHENGFSAAEVIVEEKMESHDSCLKGRGRPAKGKVKRKRKGEDIPYIKSMKTNLSESQKRVVENEVRSIKSKVPILVVAMTRSNVGVGLNHGNWMLFCSKFATRYLPCNVKSVLLKYKEKTWPTKMLIYKNRKYLGGGWAKFATENGLRNGDICLFELKEKNEKMVTMMVHIIYMEQF